MFKQWDSPNNLKQKLLLFDNFSVKYELVFDLTQIHTSLQRFLRMTNENDIISSAKLYKGFLKQLYVKARTFKIERITIFFFSFCIGLATKLNDPALGVLKHHYITKRIREFLIGNSRLLIYNLLNQFLSYKHGILVFQFSIITPCYKV